MAETRNFKVLCTKAGWCCAHGCLSIEELKKVTRGGDRITAGWLRQKFDCSPTSAKTILKRWRTGEYACEKLEGCMLNRLGGIDNNDLITLSEHRKEWLALKGKKYGLYQTKSEPVRTGVALDATVIGASRNDDWLWLRVHVIGDSSKISLGDPLYLDNYLWGTVIQIDGPNIVLLLPGDRHGKRLTIISTM